MGGRRSVWFAAATAALVVACCAAVGLAATRENGVRCGRSAKLVPDCGVLWGVTTQEPTYAATTRLEEQVGRKFDFVYRFHDVNDEIPDAEEHRQLRAGKLLHVSIGARDFADPSVFVSWADIARGRYDDALRRQAQGIGAIGRPVFVTFEHEPNQPGRVVLGTPRDFVRAWRHLHLLYEQAGVTNAVWVWVMMGAVGSIDDMGRFWPGDDYVDWISWDVYNASGCRAGRVDPAGYVSFADLVLPFYEWVHRHGPEHGMDPDKPMMISEAGSTPYPDDPARTARWYREIPYVLEQFPQIRALGLWDRTGNAACDYRFEADPVILAAVAEAGLHPWIRSGSGGEER